jgi:hypothetical protein
MVIIHFEDAEMEKRAMDFLAGRYSFKTWANGDLMLPAPALGELAAQGIAFFGGSKNG